MIPARCDLDPSRVAVWYWDEQLLKLSAFAAEALAEAGHLSFDSLSIHRSKEYNSSKLAIDPLTGGATEVLRNVTHELSGITQIFT